MSPGSRCPTSSARRWRVGVDTGGTFTDLVATDGSELRVAKVLSTPPDYERGVLDAIQSARVRIPEIDVLAHGTTVATNAVIVRGGAKTALLTTSGFRDVLELRRHNRGELYDLLWDPPEPVVRRRDRFEVRERVDYAGSVLQPLETADVEEAVERATNRGGESFAVVFLHSYANADHEHRARAIIERLRPDAYVYCSSDLLREPGEFERTSTVAINAYLGPIVARYLEALRGALANAKFGGRLFVMHSGGGLLTAETAVRVPARLVASGPAAGAMAVEREFSSNARARSPATEEDGTANVISVDIGGTSADIAVIREGSARMVNEFSAEFGSPIRFPAVDLTSIGAGGGSIASVDAGGLPSVGPRSAGANPGPAAYGRGGIEPCVTDANVVLGRLSEDTPLAGGGVVLDTELATAAVARFADRANLDLNDAALGIIEIANSNMARAIRLVTVERGLDPRTFSLVAFGGAGGLHAAELAERLEMSRVLIPIAPGVTSALGCLYVDIAHDAAEAYLGPLAECKPDDLVRIFDRLATHVSALLDLDDVAAEARELEYFVDLRYLGQRRALTLPLRPGDLDDGFADRARDQFLRQYELQFHYAATDIPIEIATLRARGRSIADHDVSLAGAATHLDGSTASSSLPSARPVVTKRGPMEATIHGRQDLRTTTSVSGPAIVREYDSTTWIPPGWEAIADDVGNLVLERLDVESGQHQAGPPSMNEEAP